MFFPSRAIFKDGTFYTTSFDVSNRYQGQILKIEKFDPGKTYTALYWDAAAKAFYVKRFSFVLSDNTPQSFIAPGAKSYLVEITDDKHPQFQVIFGKKYEHRDPENIDAEEFIAKKGYTAKGKKCHQYDLKKVRFIEPLDKPDDDPEAAPATDVILSEAKDLEAKNLPSEEPIDIMPEEPSGKLPDIDDLPDEGEFFEPTLF